MFKVIYHYSACISIHTDDLKILCDPWFTEGAYDGAWYQFPRLEKPVEKIGEVELIYISHIHPDHYDPQFLREYLSRYPKAEIIIADFSANYLQRKMIFDGFKPRLVKNLKVGNTSVAIIPNELNTYDVDSVMVVNCNDRNVVNLNDNLFNPVLFDKVLEVTSGNIDLCCLGYTGAGPYPQTYYTDHSVLKEKARIKKESFFERYLFMVNHLKPKRILPFAGKYILGGKNTNLNQYRGTADAVEVLPLTSNAFVLDDGGNEWFDVENNSCSALRIHPYSEVSIQNRVSEISIKKYDYEVDFSNLTLSKIPFNRLLRSAYSNAIKKSLVKRDYYFLIMFEHEKFEFNLNSLRPSFRSINDTSGGVSSPRSEITIDYRYLFGLVTMVYHWNNAEIGSHYTVKRVPDEFDRDVQAFLNHFHV